MRKTHKYDGDGVCEKCGFDGAEHHWLNASRNDHNPVPYPECSISTEEWEALQEARRLRRSDKY